MQRVLSSCKLVALTAKRFATPSDTFPLALCWRANACGFYFPITPILPEFLFRLGPSVLGIGFLFFLNIDQHLGRKFRHLLKNLAPQQFTALRGFSIDGTTIIAFPR